VQLIDASSFWQKMRKSLGSKRKELADAHIAEITRIFGDFLELDQAVVIDAKGKELSRTALFPGVAKPEAAAGGKVKLVPIAKVFRNEEFGYRTITVERPLRDADGKVVVGERGKLKGKPQPDASLRDTENVPLAEDVDAYFRREVLPHAPDAWIDHDKTRVGYEIPFNRHFYVFEPPRALAEIDADLKRSTDRIKAMIEGLAT
jgi:type I restriction enzyme M protein